MLLPARGAALPGIGSDAVGVEDGSKCNRKPNEGRGHKAELLHSYLSASNNAKMCNPLQITTGPLNSHNIVYSSIAV